MILQKPQIKSWGLITFIIDKFSSPLIFSDDRRSILHFNEVIHFQNCDTSWLFEYFIITE